MCQDVEITERVIYKTPTVSSQDFPGSPLVKPLCFYCRRHGLNPWSENLKIKAKQPSSCHTIMYFLAKATENRFSFSNELLVLTVFFFFKLHLWKLFSAASTTKYSLHNSGTNSVLLADFRTLARVDSGDRAPGSHVLIGCSIPLSSSASARWSPSTSGSPSHPACYLCLANNHAGLPEQAPTISNSQPALPKVFLADRPRKTIVVAGGYLLPTPLGRCANPSLWCGDESTH